MYKENQGSKISQKLFYPAITKRELKHGPKHIVLRDNKLIKQFEATFDNEIIDKEKIWGSNYKNSAFMKNDNTEELKIRK